MSLWEADSLPPRLGHNVALESMNRLQRLLWLIEQQPSLTVVPRITCAPPPRNAPRPTFAEMMASVEKRSLPPRLGERQVRLLDAEGLGEPPELPALGVSDAALPAGDLEGLDAHPPGQFGLGEPTSLPHLPQSHGTNPTTLQKIKAPARMAPEHRTPRRCGEHPGAGQEEPLT